MSELRPNADVMISFLRWLRPGGPWLVSYYNVDRHKPKNQFPTSAYGSDAELVRNLPVLVEANTERECNIYYSVNPVHPCLARRNKRASKPDIAHVEYLHMDLDPLQDGEGRDIEGDSANCVALITDNLPEGVPPPAYAMASGNGAQALWRLDKPVGREEAEAAMRWLASKFGDRADSTQNIDRVMRVPGTINWPGREKAERRGRVPRMSREVGRWKDRSYPICAFRDTEAAAADHEDHAGAGVPPPEPGEGLDGSERDVLRPIPSDDRDVWLRVGMALHYKGRASAEARALWDEWSDKCRQKPGTTYDPADQKRTWDSFKLDCHNPVRWGSVVALAREHGYEGGGSGAHFERTDMGNAQRLLAAHGKDILYCYQAKSWFIWDGRRWKQDSTGRIEQLAKGVARGMLKEAAIELGKDPEGAKALFTWAVRSQMRERLKAMVDTAHSDNAVLMTDFDADPWLLNVINGTLDLRTGRLRPHAQEDRITRIVNVEYRADARCPEFDKFLDRVMDKSEVLASFLQRALGYSLTGQSRCYSSSTATGPTASPHCSRLSAPRSVSTRERRTWRPLLSVARPLPAGLGRT